MIRLEEVTVSFDAPVLEQISLTIPNGCIYGLIGPPASGKTVLLKSIAGLQPLSSGQLWIDDQNLAELDAHELSEVQRNIGMLFQNNALFDFMTVEDNIAFPLRRLSTLAEDEVLARVARRLTAVGLPNFQPRMPTGLSGGQKKRVAVARATIGAATTLLYDEPAAGLDPVSTQKILNLLRSEQQDSNASVVMVSSDLERLLSVTDRVGMLFEGRLIFDGTTLEAQTSTDPYVHQFLHGKLDGPIQ